MKSRIFLASALLCASAASQAAPPDGGSSIFDEVVDVTSPANASGKGVAITGSVAAGKGESPVRAGGDPPAPGITFSFDFHGPSNGMPGGFGIGNIFEGDIVTVTDPGPPGPNPPAFGPLSTPAIQIRANSHFRMLGLMPGIVPSWRQEPVIEVDALSYGNDPRGRIRFSVDEFAEGDSSVPNAIVAEGALGAREAAADTFDYRGTDAPAPSATPAILFGNVHVSDGDGSGMVGVGLIEANPAVPGLPDLGDNLDALNYRTRAPRLFGPVYFSLDASFPDPIEGAPANSGSAAANGFVGGDVLVVHNTSPAMANAVVYAPATALGLDFFGPDTDDLDALAIDENGDGQYEPGQDRILFSVRRGSAIIGTPDSRLGLPITPGDILRPPGPGATVPAIYLPAEKLGLKTARSGDICAESFDAPQVNDPEQLCDDLDALDRLPLEDLDSDGDGVTDDVDNCWYVPNPGQTDGDGDGIGNACDADFDNDCLVNVLDLGIIRLAFFATPGDPRWNPEADINDDGIINAIDLGLVKSMFFGTPGPSGQPNDCDCSGGGQLLAAREQLLDVDPSCALPAGSLGSITDGSVTYDIRGLAYVDGP